MRPRRWMQLGLLAAIALAVALLVVLPGQPAAPQLSTTVTNTLDGAGAPTGFTYPTVREGGGRTVRFSLDSAAPAGGVNIGNPGTPRDGTLVVESTVIDEGATSKGFPITRNQNTVDTPNYLFTHVYPNNNGFTVVPADLTTRMTVIDDDPTVVTLARVGSGEVSEGGTAQFTVSLGRALVDAGTHGPAETIVVPLEIGGGASTADAADWSIALDGGSPNTGATLTQPTATEGPKVTFSGAGAQTAVLNLDIEDDNVLEVSSELLQVALASNTNFDAESGTNVGGGADPMTSGTPAEPQSFLPTISSEGAITVPADWPLMPDGLNEGDEFRLMFMTSQKRDATSTDIADYDTFVQNSAGGSSAHAEIKLHASRFTVVGSTREVDARDHTGTDPNNDAHMNVPIYWLNGKRVAADNSRFWSSTWENWAMADRRNEAGNRGGGDQHWSGTDPDGTASLTGSALGENTPTQGQFRISEGTLGPMSNGQEVPKAQHHSFYVISPVFRKAITPPTAATDTTVPADWDLMPAGLNDGDEFRLIFMTSQKRDATSSDIADYDAFVQNSAGGSGAHTAIRPYASLFKAVGSTRGVSARDHTDTNPHISSHKNVPIYWLNGERVALNKAGFWGSTWEHWTMADRRTEAGSTGDNDWHWTGTDPDGTVPGFSGAALGENTPRRGRFKASDTDTRPLSGGTNAPKAQQHSLYAISPVFKKEIRLRVEFRVCPSGATCVEGSDAGWVVHDIDSEPPTIELNEGGADVSYQFRLRSPTSFRSVNVEVTHPGDGIMSATHNAIRPGERDYDRLICRDGSREIGLTSYPADASNIMGGPGQTIHLPQLGVDGGGNAVYSDQTGGCPHNPRSITWADRDAWQTVTVAAGEDPDAFDHVTSLVHYTVATDAAHDLFQKTPHVRANSNDHDDRADEWPVRIRILDDDEWEQDFLVKTGDTTWTSLSDGGLDHVLPDSMGQGDEHTFKMKLKNNPATLGVRTSAFEILSFDSLNANARVSSSVDDWPSRGKVVDWPADTHNGAWNGEVTFTVHAADDAGGLISVKLTAQDLLRRVDNQLPVAGATHNTRSYTHNLTSTTCVGICPAGIIFQSSSDWPTLHTPSDLPREQLVQQPEVSITAGSGITEGGDATFTVTASPAPAADLDVSITVSQSGDYGAATGQQTVTIPTTGSATLTVGTTNDGADEADGSVTATINTGSGYTVSSAQSSGTVTVADDDDPPVVVVPVVTISGGSGVTEGGDASFTVSASPAPAANLDVSLTVSQSGDYGATTGPKTVTISSSGSVTLSVSTTNDEVDEADGSVTATLVDGSDYDLGATTTATVDVADDDPATSTTERTDQPARIACSDPPTISVSNAEALPSDRSADFTISLDCKPSGTVTAYYVHTREGSIDGGVKIVKLTSDEPSHTVSVEINGTRRLEVQVVYATGAANYRAKGSLSIVKERSRPRVVTPPTIPVVSISGGSGITEGGNASFTVTASPAPAANLDVSVTVSQSGNFGATTGQQTVTIPITGSVTLTVGTTDDGADEADGSVTATLDTPAADAGYTVSATQGAATVSVSDDDDPPLIPPPPPTPEVSITAGGGVTEGGDATFTVTASPAPSANLDVSVTVSQSGDYGAATGQQTVTIPTTGSVTLTVGTTNDGADEADGSVTATLDTPSAGDGYTVSATQGAATVAVADDDVPEISISAGNGVTEGGDASFTVTASPAPAANLDVSVTVSASGDYGATTGQQTVTIPTAGSVTLTVGTTNDGADEADGSVTATLDTPAADAGYTVSATQGAATVSVADDDVPEISITAGNGVTEGGDASFTVTASPAPAANLDVSVTVSQSGDYGAATGQQTVTIPTAGSVTLTVSTANDDTDEADGSVTATVNTGSGYTVSSSQGAATVSVADDDDASEPEAKLSVTVEDASGTEGDVVKFRILLSHALTEEFEVSWYAGTAYHLLDDRAHSSDYQAMSGVMEFAPGVTELTGEVWLEQDNEEEPDEYFAVEAFLPGEWRTPAAVGTMTIVDDD